MTKENNNTQFNEIHQGVTEELNSNIQQSGNDSEKKPSKKWSGILFTAIIIIGAVVIFKAIFSGSAHDSPYKSYVQKNPADEITSSILSTSAGPQINSLAPDFTTYDTQSNRVVLSSFRSQKPVLLIFWATWCGYCAKELPDLKTFSQKHGDQVQILAIASGETKDTIQTYIQEKDVNFTVLLDETREIWNDYLVRGTPAHFLINQQGKIVILMPGLVSLADMETMLTMVK